MGFDQAAGALKSLSSQGRCTEKSGTANPGMLLGDEDFKAGSALSAAEFPAETIL